MTLCDASKKQNKNTSIFFGEYNGVQRYDYYIYPFARNIERKMRGAFWQPEEIKLDSDRLNFESLPLEIKNILKAVWKFQTTADSVQNRGLDNYLANIVTSPEWEAVFKTQGYFELLHSISYSHILRSLFPDSTDVLDELEFNKEIHIRFQKEVAIYEQLLSKEVTKETVLETLLRIYALERLKFGASFLTTYLINSNYGGKISGVTRIIKLIHNDENLHTTVMSGLLNILKKNKQEGFTELFESGYFNTLALKIFEETVADELAWGSYLLSLGNIPSLTSPILENFLNYFAKDALTKVGVPFTKKVEKSDIVDFYLLYQDINADNTAQQEAESLAYNMGQLQNDLTGEIVIRRLNK